ncbi:disintegrin and metalloproteinase domain-containing protein 10-like [Dermacentor andersoni]|uniref:disintegrin and metalloproteinase domain-containing protein 10-like n=1 Tax=Dermacentor andersoni TaxID=34620 RepID=UPI002415978F|nr:disintegrin and metalloproteinase domain-containing protein 10 homolog [Dermacentor andersoni]
MFNFASCDNGAFPYARWHRREFRLQLTQDRSAFSEDFSLVTSRGRVQASLDHIYSGHVAGAPGSRVVGAMMDGVFSGRISLTPGDDDGDFYVERAGPYLSSSSSPTALFHSLIYAARDVSFDGAGCGVHGHEQDSLDDARRRHRPASAGTQVPQARRTNGSALGHVPPEAEPRWSNRRMVVGAGDLRGGAHWQLRSGVQRVCNLEIKVDHTFYGMVSSDLNGDATKVRASITEMVFTHVASATEIFGRTNFHGITDISFVVQRLQINDSSHCEGSVRDTNPYCGDTLDAAHTLAELSKSNHNMYCLSYLWTYRDFPKGTLGLAYVAEVNELHGPFCGNSIREEDEECDCGFDWHECREMCCYPREHGQLNRKGCTLRPNAKCSPSNSACCSDSCQYHNSTWVCRNDDDCQFEAYCDGSGGKCPPSENKRDGVLCNHRSQVCRAGECTGSLCHLHDLEECYLTGSQRTPDELCLVACRENVTGSACMEACRFERMKDFCNKKMEPGAPCDNMRGYCDVFQRCRLVDAEGPLARLHWLVFGGRGLKNLLVRYWYFTLMAVIACGGVTALLVKLCAVHTPSSNPLLKRPHKVVDTVRRPMSLLRT